ncbi:hypothetical protein DFH08DRAFT_715852, partial [Mycena albidolilacea]
FLAGDVLDRGFLARAEPQPTATSTAPSPPLSTIRSLIDLSGHISILHTSYLFHMFDEQEQTDLVRSMAGLLSPLPGSMIFGSQVGSKTTSYRPRPPRYTGDRAPIFAPSPESWTAIWEDIFPKGAVHIEATLREREDCHPWELLAPVPGLDDGVFTWSITRL